jgi:hypothetical protein
MPVASPGQVSFNRGELTPLVYGRVDLEQYKTGLLTCENYIPMVQGGLMRRPGSKFVAKVKSPTSANNVRLIPFKFSTTQAYVIEAGNTYFRFFANRAAVISGTPVEVVTPYLSADLFQIKFTQSADVLYLAHPSYPPKILSRTSPTAFSFSDYVPEWGPFLEENSTATTIQASAATGTGITLTASTSIFQASHVGAYFQLREIIPSLYDKWQSSVSLTAGSKRYYLGRLYQAGAHIGQTGTRPPIHDSGTVSDGNVPWTYLRIDRGYVKITGYTSGTVVTADVIETLPDSCVTAGIKTWSEGAWSAVRGYPATVTFYEDRLFWGGTNSRPQTVWGSKSSNYTSFQEVDAEGNVQADGSLALTLNSNDVNAIYWLSNEERALLIGTAGGEWVLRPASTSSPLSPDNVAAKESTKFGSANMQAIRADRTTLFVQRGSRNLRELAYVFEIDGFKSPDMTVLAEHITSPGLQQIDFQKIPYQILWGVTGEKLVGLTYERDQEVIGWHKHSFGGGGTVKSVACITEPNGTYDDVWAVVQRTIGGTAEKWIEYIGQYFPEKTGVADSYYLDAGYTYSGVSTSSVTGLTWLANQTVSVLIDGAVHPDVTVSAGGVATLTRSGTKIHVGFSYNSDGATMRIDAGQSEGTAQAKIKRIHRVAFRVHQSLGLKVGPTFTTMYRPPLRSAADLMGNPVPLFSGDIIVKPWEGSYDTNGYICFRADQPLPCHILALFPQLQTQDG